MTLVDFSTSSIDFDAFMGMELEYEDWGFEGD